MKIKRWIGVLLCMLLCVGMLPTIAFAAEEYKVLIEGHWVTSDNANDVLNDGGSVTYDKDSNTVTLDNATLTSNIYCNTGSALNIVVNGTNTMNCADNVSTAISNFGDYPINISGNGSLTITVAIYKGNAIRGDVVTIDGTTLELHTSGTALSGYPLTLKNGAKVTAELSEGSDSIAVGGSIIEISDSTLTATSPLGNSILGDSIKIENSTVTGTGYYPIMSDSGDITIINSTVKAESTADWGIWSRSNLLIKGNSDITAMGSIAALGAANSFTLEPLTGELIDVFVGADKDNAAAIDNSPLSQETDLGAYGNNSIKYFHSAPHKHTYDQRVASDEYKASDATCTEPAKYYQSCVCGAKGTETFEEGTTAHDMAKNDKIEATCTTAGKEAYYTCEVCGKYFEDEAGNTEITNLDEWGIIPAVDHKAGTEWKSDGTNHWNECVNCGEKMNEAAHDFEWVTDKEATATEAGSKHEKCTVCGYAKAAVEIPATGTTTDPTKPTTPDDTSKPADTTKPDGTTDSTSPQTGDNSNIALWIVVMLAAGAVLTGTAVYSRKRKYNR